MNEQGRVKCWVDILPINEPPETLKPWDITPKPPQTFEVRVCIFNCKDVDIMDWEGTTDAFVKGYFDSKEEV